MDRHAPSRARLSLVVVPLIALAICSYVGDALAPSLVNDHPVWLIALNARNRNLILVTNLVDTVPYYFVGTLRLLASDPLFYVLGWWYGDAAVKWVENRSSTFGGMLRTWEWLFQKAAWPLVAIAPNNVICLFAGAAGMTPSVFLTLNVAGTIGRLYLIRILGKTFQKPIDWLLDFIGDYRIPLTVLSIALVLLTVWWDRRKGSGEIEALASLEEDMEEIEEELEAEQPADGAEE